MNTGLGGIRATYRRWSGALALPAGASGLNLGCGRRPLPGFVNVDQFEAPGVDALVDLEGSLPYQDGSFDLVVLDNVLEHISRSVELLKECRRVVRDGGHVIVDVPYFRSAGAFIDPTHENFYTLRSMRYFVPGTYESERYGYFPQLFRAVDVVVDPGSKRSFQFALSLLASRRPEWVEDTPLWVLAGIRSLRFVLQA